MRFHSRLSLALILGLSVVDLARADTVFGKVVDPSNNPVAGAQVYVSGLAAPVVTNAQGLFAAVVATGTYVIEIVPGTTNLVPVRFLAVQVVVSKDMGTIQLKAGFPLTGRVVTTTNLPVVGADLNVYEQATGESLFTPSDNTDLNGNFMAVVPTGTYRVRIRPAATVLLVAEEIRDVVVTAATSVGSITLRPGVQVTGTVVDSTTRAPVVGVDVDVTDDFGKRIIISNDRTLANGTFAIVLPVGLAHFAFKPPLVTNYVGYQLLNQDITGATNIGVIALVPGIRLSGRLLGPGATPVVDADIDVDTAIGAVRIFTPHDSTDLNGNYSVVVPAGTYRLTFEPRKTDLLVGTRTGSITANANTTLPDTVLSRGVLLSGTITGHDSKPEVGADIDVTNPTTGEELVTGDDDTDSFGRYSVVVPTGTWNVRIQTSKVSLSRVEWIKPVVISGPTTLNRTLGIAPVATYFATSGVPTISNGGPVPSLLAFANFTAQTQNTNASIVFIDPLGKETVLVGPLFLQVPSMFSFVTLLVMPTPAINPSLLGLQCYLEARFDDPVTGQEQDHSRFAFFVR